MSKAKPEQANSSATDTNNAQSGHEDPAENEATESQATESGAGQSQDEDGELQEQLEQLKAVADQYKDQSLRAMAELENVRRRAQRDVEAARKFALEKMAGELLGVRDSLEMGLQAAREENGNFESLKEGTELTLRMFASAMEKFGIEPINPEGETFNPDLHEAMTTQESAEHPANTVLHVMQKGYQLNGRVLRPAMVVVSKPPQAQDDARHDK